MAIDLSALEAEVARDKTVNDSAATLIAKLASLFEAAKADPAKIQAIVDSLRANSDNLSAAVEANTPAEGGGEGGGQ